MIKDGKLASVYAEAVLDLARAANSREDIEQELHALNEAMHADQAVWKFFESPVVPVDDKVRVLEKTLKGQLSELLFNFLGVLARRKRMNHIPDIAQVYTMLLDEELKRRRVDLQVAAATDQALIDRIREALQSYLKSEVVLEVRENPELIGGLIVRSGDLLIDTSLRSGLNRIGASLRERKIIGEDYYEN